MSSSDDNLSRKILVEADKAQFLHDTFRKFVPTQFIEHLSAGRAEDLALGHADEDEVAVMFVDINGFTAMCEALTPQQILNFLNAFFTRMNAPIHAHHGFIDKFLGDAIMALFDRRDASPTVRQIDALLAAQGIMQSLALYNTHRANSGYQPIAVKIGIHYGPVIIGTVGSHDRMDTTVIGDTVNIANRLESLCKAHSETCLVSGVMREAIAKCGFEQRSLGQVQLRGKQTMTDVVAVRF
jgi:adenylate cyclase